MRTNEGVSAWSGAINALDAQPTLLPFKWNDYLALACDDHCRDTSRSGHIGSNGSKPWDRMLTYGAFGGKVAENI